MALAKYPVFSNMSEDQIKQYIVDYISTRIPISSPLLKRISFFEREDILNDMYIDLWTNRFKYDPKKGAFSTYVYNRCRHVVGCCVQSTSKLNSLRQKLRAETISTLSKDELKLETLSNILSEFSSNENDLLRMRYEKRYSIINISNITQKSISSIYKNIDDLLIKIKEKMGEDSD